MLRNALFTLAVVLLPLDASAQTGTLLGFVRDGDIYSGADITGATVKLSDGRQAVTLADGKYQFDSVPAGAVTVTASAPGYDTKAETKDIVAGVTNWKSIALAKTCVPSCAGTVCGNDGCGGSCGACAPGAACVAGACACTPDSYKGCCGDAVCQFDSCGAKGAQGEACKWGCSAGACQACKPACDGKTCGDDGCGGTCGSCAAPESCLLGQCGCGPADHNACCLDKVCQYDSCGHVEQQVAECAHGCHAGACIQCTPTCDGLQCGDDGCGGSCGGCDDGKLCRNGHCACVVLDHQACCGNEICWFDSCGVEEESVTACPNGCKDGQCNTCTPQCDGVQCGDDGCGGACGTCPDGTQCHGSVCICNSRDHAACCGNALCWFNSCDAAEGEILACVYGCADGRCNECQPQCEDKVCGDDGCGGRCPDRCGAGYQCTDVGCVVIPTGTTGTPTTPDPTTGGSGKVTPNDDNVETGIAFPKTRGSSGATPTPTGIQPSAGCQAAPSGAIPAGGLVLLGLLAWAGLRPARRRAS